jgi:hypothetical protein
MPRGNAQDGFASLNPPYGAGSLPHFSMPALVSMPALAYADHRLAAKRRDGAIIVNIH